MIDFNLDPGAPSKSSDLGILLQQIELLFDTYPGEVLGDDEFGTTYDEYLYQLKLSNDDLRDEIMRDITSNIDLLGYDVDVHVYVLDGTERDILLVNINFARDGEQYSKSYRVI